MANFFIMTRINRRLLPHAGNSGDLTSSGDGTLLGSSLGLAAALMAVLVPPGLTAYTRMSSSGRGARVRVWVRGCVRACVCVCMCICP